MKPIVIVSLAGAITMFAASPVFAVHQVFYFPTPHWGPGLGTEIETFDGQDSVVSPLASAPATTLASQSLEGASASARVVTVATPYPALTASAVASLSGNLAASAHAGAAATLTYSFEIAGPDGNVSATIGATGSTSNERAGSADSSGIAILDIYSQSGALVNDIACGGSGVDACAPGEGPTIALNQSFSLVANQDYVVYMSIAADADATYVYGVPSSLASASAYLDPHITIDPGYAAAYSLSVTPGVGNASPAPEPAAWAMLLIGFGLVGGALRRRGRGNADFRTA